MIITVTSALRRLAVLWTDLVRRFAWVVLLVSLALTALSAVYVVDNFAINSDTDEMLAPDLPYRRLEREFRKAFPQLQDKLLVVVDGDTPDLADDAAAALARQMRLQPRLFRSIFYPQGEPFFRRNGLLYPSVDQLEELSDRLAEAQPFLGALAKDPSLRGLFDLLGLAAEQMVKGAEQVTGNLDYVLDQISGVIEAQLAGRFAQLSWQRLMTGRTGNKGGAERRFLVVDPALDYGSIRPAAKAIGAVRSLVSWLALDEEHGARVRLTGNVALDDDELDSVTFGMGTAGVVSLLLVVALLTICLRSPRMTVAALVTLIVGLVWTAGFAVAAVGALNLISVAFAVLFIGLSVDFSIHYALRYREARERTDDHASALRGAARSVVGALTLSAVAAAIGFFSFLPTEYLGLAELGLIAGVGMGIALFTSMTVLPALMTLIRPRLRKAVTWESPKKQLDFAAWVRRHHRPVVWTSAVLGITAAAALPYAQFDFDPLHLKNQNSESVSTLIQLMEDDPTARYSIGVLAKNLQAAERMAALAAALKPVYGTRTLLDFVPEEQEEKLDIIATLALLLEPSLTAPQVASPNRNQTFTALRQLQRRLQDLAAHGDAQLRAAANRLRADLAAVVRRSVGNQGIVKDLEWRLLKGLPGRLAALRDSLEPEPVTLDNLPQDVRSRWLTDDGRARLEIYPAKEIQRDREALVAFVKAVRSAIPTASGPPIGIYEAGRAVINAFIEAGVISVVAIALMLVVLLKSIRHTVLVFSPLILAALLTVAASVLLHLPFNFANLIVLPLLFGLGVAGSLHLVIRDLKESGDVEALRTSTPRAVTFSALTTIASFGSLGLSDHPGTASMGILLTVSLALTLVCTLVVLPAVLVMVEGNGRQAAAGRGPQGRGLGRQRSLKE